MEYSGKLYGKVGSTYIPLEMTTDDVENLQKQLDVQSAKGRNVLFKKWIPSVYEKATSGWNVVKGTGVWEEDFSHAGIFHTWANAYEESSAGFGNFMVALIELPDGTIESVLPQNMKFVVPSH